MTQQGDEVEETGEDTGDAKPYPYFQNTAQEDPEQEPDA